MVVVVVDVVVVVGSAVTSIHTVLPRATRLSGAGLWFTTEPGWETAEVASTCSATRPARSILAVAVVASRPPRSGTATCSVASTGSTNRPFGGGSVVVGAGLVSGSINGVGSTPSSALRMNVAQICAG